MSGSELDLDSRRAVVTGASSGIGAAVARRLHEAGAAVAGVARRPELVPLGSIPIQADLAIDVELDAVVDRAVEALGGIDILVNAAGTGERTPLETLARSNFDRVVALNLWAPLRICQHAHPYLAAADDAAVVMIGSVDAQRPEPDGVVYGATKAGLAAATLSLARAWAGDGIRVTQVDPGLIETPMAADFIAAVEDSGATVNLVGRPGRPDEIAGLVHYLVSPLGRFANAATFRIDGGALSLGPVSSAQR